MSSNPIHCMYYGGGDHKTADQGRVWPLVVGKTCRLGLRPIAPSPPFDNIWSYGDCLEVKREYYKNCFIYCQRATSSMGTVNKNSSYSRLGLESFYVFLGCM